MKITDLLFIFSLFTFFFFTVVNKVFSSEKKEVRGNTCVKAGYTYTVKNGIQYTPLKYTPLRFTALQRGGQTKFFSECLRLNAAPADPGPTHTFQVPRWARMTSAHARRSTTLA